MVERDHARAARVPLSRRRLSDSVHDAVLAMLMDHRLAPDDALSIDGLAGELGVSQTPVREAVARLEASGLVRRVAPKGFRVAPPMTAEEVASLMKARLVLEPVLAQWACERSTPAFVETLRGLVRAHRDAGRSPGHEGFRELVRIDDEFHAAIRDQSGNEFLGLALDALSGQIQRFRLFAGQGVMDAERAVAEHLPILDAFAEGSPEGAAAAMRGHLLNVAARDAAARPADGGGGR